MLRTLCATIILSTISILAVAASAAGPVDEPYTVYVNEDGSYTRCGPSREHYRTDKLSEGEALEVYLETADGWLGIRPPESSFCWLPSDQVELEADSAAGKIIDPAAVAWIGTHLGQARKYRWQVQFQIGEPVTIIGEAEREAATGEKEIWYRIVPPPGEFRWVHDSQIVKSREALAQSRRQRESKQMTAAVGDQPASSAQQDDSPDTVDAPPAPFDLQAAREQVAARGGVIATPNVAQVAHEEPSSNRDFQSRLNVTDNVRVRDMQSADPPPAESADLATPWVQTARSRPLAESASSRNAQASAMSPREASGDAAAQLHQMQVELARLMAADASAQQADPLRAQVELLIQTASDPVDRGRARLLGERIVKFQAIANSRGGTQVSQGDPNAQSDSAADAASARQGWLVQVYSARPDAPPFALTDGDGKMIAYVSPAVGMNLRRLLNREVEVIGKPNYRTGTDTPHLIARQVERVQR